MTLLQVSDTLDDMTTIRPAPADWSTPTYVPPPRRSPVLTLAVAAVGLIASAGLAVGIVALARESTVPPTTAPAAPVFTQDQIASARADLCATWSLASDAVKAETHRSDPALARIAMINSASMLEAAAVAPALSQGDHAVALNVAQAYRKAAAISSTESEGMPEFDSAREAANSASNALQSLCAG